MLDDMIVTGATRDEHLCNLRAVLNWLKQYGLRLNVQKCECFKNKFDFLGHIVNEHGLHKSPDKIEAMLKYAIPENVSQLRSFLGLVNYYHKFLRNLSSVISPLRRLLEKNVVWEWSSDCEIAFDDVRSCIASE